MSQTYWRIDKEKMRVVPVKTPLATMLEIDEDSLSKSTEKLFSKETDACQALYDDMLSIELHPLDEATNYLFRRTKCLAWLELLFPSRQAMATGSTPIGTIVRAAIFILLIPMVLLWNEYVYGSLYFALVSAAALMFGTLGTQWLWSALERMADKHLMAANALKALIDNQGLSDQVKSYTLKGFPFQGETYYFNPAITWKSSAPKEDVRA